DCVCPGNAGTPDTMTVPRGVGMPWRRTVVALERSMSIRFTSVLGMAALAAGPILFPHEAGAKMTKQDFGQMPDATAVSLYTLTNKNGMEARIMTYGGIVVSLKTPDRAGRMADVVQGFDSLDGYLKPNPYFGAVIGRYGNRIGHAQFTLDGHEYGLPKN